MEKKLIRLNNWLNYIKVLLDYRGNEKVIFNTHNALKRIKYFKILHLFSNTNKNILASKTCILYFILFKYNIKIITSFLPKLLVMLENEGFKRDSDKNNNEIYTYLINAIQNKDYAKLPIYLFIKIYPIKTVFGIKYEYKLDLYEDMSYLDVVTKSYPCINIYNLHEYNYFQRVYNNFYKKNVLYRWFILQKYKLSSKYRSESSPYKDMLCSLLYTLSRT